MAKIEETQNENWPDIMEKEIGRLKNLREDVLLLRFFLARRTDISELISDTDRLISETALKSSLDILESVKKGKKTIVGDNENTEDADMERVAAAASALMHSVDVLVKAARLAAPKDGTGELPSPVTPESLRASLPEEDIARGLGEKVKDVKERLAPDRASTFILRKVCWAMFFFLAALAYHFMITSSLSLPDPGGTSPLGFVYSLLTPSKEMNFSIVVSAFLWAMTGSYIWILIRFRKFDAAYTFDPAQAKVFEARVYSGAITTAVLLYFVFGGGEEQAWAKNWKVDLPLWAFVLGYAGRLQVALLTAMVERIEDGINTVFPARQQKSKTPPDDALKKPPSKTDKPK